MQKTIRSMQLLRTTSPFPRRRPARSNSAIPMRMRCDLASVVTLMHSATRAVVTRPIFWMALSATHFEERIQLPRSVN